MKLIRFALVVALLAGASLGTAYAADKASALPPDKYDRAVTNLLIGLHSDNLGLRNSAACILGDLKAGRAVIPLMAMLHNAQDETSRIVAALALSRIGDARGQYAVKTAAIHDDSERVRKYCAWFYNEYVEAGSFSFVAIVVPAFPAYAAIIE